MRIAGSVFSDPEVGGSTSSGLVDNRMTPKMSTPIERKTQTRIQRAYEPAWS